MRKAKNPSELKFVDLVTQAEYDAFVHPESFSYHSYHLERVSPDLFYLRDSRELMWYVLTAAELLAFITANLGLRKVDPRWEENNRTTQVLTLLSQSEVDDLLGDI